MSAEVKEQDSTKTDEYIKQLPAVAKKMFLPCKKCDANRFFIVVAHKTERSAKLQCEICKANKSFTIKKPKKVASTTTRRRTKAPTPQQLWEMLNHKYGSEGIDYTMTAVFELNSVINHKKFGLGYVVSVEPNKIEVAFEEIGRFLVHNRQ